MSTLKEQLGIGSTLLGGFGSGIDAVSHNLISGRAILDVREKISEWKYIGNWLAEHSGNITQSMGPAIVVTLLGESLKDMGKERGNKSLEYLGNFVEFTGYATIVAANIMSEAYYDWPNFLFKDVAHWQEIWQYNDQFNGDIGAGLVALGLGIIAVSGLRQRYMRLATEDMNV